MTIMKKQNIWMEVLMMDIVNITNKWKIFMMMIKDVFTNRTMQQR